MARAKNGDGSRAALTVSFERRNQFRKSGTTFEKIQFELVWLRNGNSGHTKEVLPMMNRSWIGRGTLESCRAFVPNAMFLITNFAWRLTQTPYKRRSKKTAPEFSSLRSRYDNCLKVIVARAVVFLPVLFSFRAPAAPGCAQLQPALHHVVAHQVGHRRPGL